MKKHIMTLLVLLAASRLFAGGQTEASAPPEPAEQAEQAVLDIYC